MKTPLSELLNGKKGAKIILGENLKSIDLTVPLIPSSIQMFAPRGACLMSNTGSLWVSDTGHHRLLGWERIPTRDNQPADWVIGQPDFMSEGQNAKSTPGGNTFSVPTGICRCGDGLAVADAWNHRVLIWNSLPQGMNVPADLVLGQVNFTENQANRGYRNAAANTLNWCYGVYYYQDQYQEKLFVADTGNRRLLIWNQLPTENGQPADLVLGQPDMNSRDENGGVGASSSSMRWCHDITIWDGDLAIADAGNNRVMIWEGIPDTNNTPCTAVLGQKSFNFVEINQGEYFPNSGSLSMPYGVAAFQDWLLVTDTANSRLLGWKKPDSLSFLQGKSADILIGQDSFNSKSENRSYGKPSRDSLNWSYGIKIQGNMAVIADSGNNRILLWEL